MNEKIHFDYFYGTEADQFTFYRIPKLLIMDPYFKTVSNDAKILYGLMLDRMSLSVKNGWIDAENRVYIYFSVSDTMELLNIGKNKAVKIIAELDSEEGIGLIEKKQQGQGKPALIYVKSFIREKSDEFENQTPEPKEEVPEVYKTNFKEFENQTSRSLKSKPLGVYFSNPNNNKYNYININNTNLSILSTDGMDLDGWKRKIYEKLELEILISRNPVDKDIYLSILDMVLEVVLCKTDSFRVAGAEYPTELVRERFLNLDSSHVEYVVLIYN